MICLLVCHLAIPCGSVLCYCNIVACTKYFFVCTTYAVHWSSLISLIIAGVSLLLALKCESHKITLSVCQLLFNRYRQTHSSDMLLQSIYPVCPGMHVPVSNSMNMFVGCYCCFNGF